jgi:hypothetical protein
MYLGTSIEYLSTPQSVYTFRDFLDWIMANSITCVIAAHRVKMSIAERRTCSAMAACKQNPTRYSRMWHRADAKPLLIALVAHTHARPQSEQINSHVPQHPFPWTPLPICRFEAVSPHKASLTDADATPSPTQSRPEWNAPVPTVEPSHLQLPTKITHRDAFQAHDVLPVNHTVTRYPWIPSVHSFQGSSLYSDTISGTGGKLLGNSGLHKPEVAKQAEKTEYSGIQMKGANFDAASTYSVAFSKHKVEAKGRQTMDAVGHRVDLATREQGAPEPVVQPQQIGALKGNWKQYKFIPNQHKFEGCSVYQSEFGQGRPAGRLSCANRWTEKVKNPFVDV